MLASPAPITITLGVSFDASPEPFMNRFSLLVFALSSCVLTSVGTVSAGPQSDKIELGMVAPLTGDFAPYGRHIQKGVELAQSELENKGLTTHLIAEDGCLPAQVRSALAKLTSVDRISALVGSYCVIGMVASESALESTKTVGFQTSGGTKEILGAGDYLYTTSAKTADEASALAELAYNKLKLRNAAILYLTTQWGEEFNQVFSERFKALGGTITGTVTNPIGQNDFRTELVKLRTGNPDALVIVHLASTLGIVIKQAREIGHTGQLLGTTDGEETSVIDQCGKSAEGLLLLAPEPKEETEQMKSFRRSFVTRYEHEPHPLSRHSYDATMLATTALTECKMDRECAKAWLYRVRDYRGASGSFSINADGGTTRTFVSKIVRNGQFIREE
jgi:branched-chain amino acid transport system substrate-binding protein